MTEDILVESITAGPTHLRIAIVTETYAPEVNGVAMTMGRIVDGLVCRGHVVQLIRPQQAQGPKESSLHGFEEIFSRGMPLPTYGELRFGLPAKKRLLKLWAEQRPDVVHVVTEGPLGWSAVAAAQKLHLPLTSSFHTNFQSYSSHYGLSLLRAPIDSYLRKLHNRTQTTMVPTRALQHSLQARGYHNVKVLSRGVACELFSPHKRSKQLRAKWGVGLDDLVVMLVGRLAKEKNVGLTISAYRAFQAAQPTAKLVLVGDGPMRDALAKSCPDVIFAGVQKGEALAAHYASADVFLFPSLTETFGNVVPEALASGLALVSYANAAAQELVTHGVNGLLAPDDDEHAFTQAALRLATDASLRSRVRAAAAPSVAHLGWEHIFDSFVGHVQQVLQQSQPGFHGAVSPRPMATVSRANA